MNNEYLYDAFLSYSRVDDNFAQALHESLERAFFRLSKELRGGKKKLHIIKDVTDVDGGENMDRRFEEVIVQCRHLIVICSEAVLKKPQFVNKEIKYFKKDRGDNISRLDIPDHTEPLFRRKQGHHSGPN